MPKRYTKEFKREAVALAQQEGNSYKQVAESLGIHENTIYKWSRELKKHGQDAFPGSGHQLPEQQELSKLRKELLQVKTERDILKKALQFFAKE